MVFAITHRRWAAAFGADVTYGIDVTYDDVGVDDAAVGDASVDHPDKAHRALLVRVLTVNACIGLAAVAVQTGIESGVALWGFTFLTEAVGVSAVIAGGLASGYWVAMVVGRLVLGSLAERIGAWRVMGPAVGGMVVAAGLAIAATPSTATTAILLFGLSTAPMYPLLVLTTAQRTSAAVADRLIGFQAAASRSGCGNPTAYRSCHGSVGQPFRAGDRTALPDRSAADSHADAPTPLVQSPLEGRQGRGPTAADGSAFSLIASPEPHVA